MPSDSLNGTVAPFVSVIIPHFNDLHGLDLCLNSLMRQTYPKDRTEIVIGDNASPQGEAEVRRVVAERAKVVVVTERGAGPARNGAVAASRGEILAFIDSDCIAEPDWLTGGVAALETSDFVGGLVNVLTADPQHVSSAEAFEMVFAFDFENYILKQGFTGSGNLFCPRTVFEAVGGFRSGVAEDVEWSQRATGLGYRLGLARGAVIGHPARRDWKELSGKWRRVLKEQYLLARERPRGRGRWFVKALAMPLSALAHTPKVLTTPKLNSARQRLLALLMLYRLRIWRGIESLRLVLAIR